MCRDDIIAQGYFVHNFPTCFLMEKDTGDIWESGKKMNGNRNGCHRDYRGFRLGDRMEG